MKMIFIGQCWVIWIAPAFGIQMQTKHEIGMQFSVHQYGATADFAIAIEQDFALPANRLLFLGIVWIKNIRSRLGHAVFDQNSCRQLPEIIRTFRRNWLVAVSDKEDFRTQFSEARRQQPGHPQRQIAFLDRRAAAVLKPALFHLRPFPAEMPRIERDAQTGERFLWFCGRQGLRETPETWHRLARRFVLGEAQGEELLRLAVRQNPRALLIYRNQVRRETVSAINVINQSGELIMGNCFLIFFQHVPPGMSAKNSEVVRSVAGAR